MDASIAFILVSMTLTCCRVEAFKPGRSMKWKILNYDSSYNDTCLSGLSVLSKIDTTFSPEEEKSVLLDLYRSTGGSSYWLNKTHWNNSEVNHCKWFGVTCHNGTSGYIVGITLGRNNLTGTFPNFLWRLRNLQSICIYNNPQLKGEMKNFIFPNMTTLELIDIAFCDITGEVPTYVTQLTNLVKLQICCQAGKGLTGRIPPQIGNLTKLQVLSIGENDFSGPIPESIGKLSKLWFLDFDTLKKLDGNINLFTNLSSLQYMHLSNAGIRGGFPPSFGYSFPLMKQCLLPGNKISGNIPLSFAAMQNLEQLQMSNNLVNGSISRSLFEIPSLKVLDLSHNFLVSLEKKAYYTISKLEILMLADNKKFTSDFTMFIETISFLKTTLRVLNVSNCNLSGIIPAQIYKFEHMIYLDLQSNHLQGMLPQPQYDLLFLVFMDLSNNSLSGSIPTTFTQLHVLQFLDISGNSKMSVPETNKGELESFLEVDLQSFVKRNPGDHFKCPNARILFNNGRVILDPEYYHFRFCVCDVGYYGYDGNCKVCLSGAKCEEENEKVVYPSLMSINAGYWPSPSCKNVSHLTQCSSNPLTQQNQLSCNPSASCKCRLVRRSNSTTRFVTECNEECICREGSTGRLCSRCKDGFYRSGGLCYPCEKYKLSWYVFLVFLVITLIVLWWAMFYFKKRRTVAFLVTITQVVVLAFLRCFEFIPGWLFEIHVVVLIFSLAGRGYASGGLLKIAIFYLQIVDAMLAENDIWPLEVVKARYYLSNVVNFHFSGLSCQFPELFKPVGQLLFVLLCPGGFVIAMWIYQGVMNAWYSYCKRIDKIIALKCNCLKMTIVTLTLTYFPIVKKTTSALSPCDIDGNMQFLRMAPWIECRVTNQDFLHLRIIAGFSLLLYVLGVPFIYAVLLRTFYRKRSMMNQMETQMLDYWMGSIYLPYKKKYQSFFEIVSVFGKLLLASSISIVPVTTLYQTFAIAIVLSFAIILILTLKPYAESWKGFPLENAFDAAIMFILLHSFILLRFAILDESARTSLVWIIIGVNSVLFAGLVIAVLVTLTRPVRKEDKQQKSSSVSTEVDTLSDSSRNNSSS